MSRRPRARDTSYWNLSKGRLWPTGFPGPDSGRRRNRHRERYRRSSRSRTQQRNPSSRLEAGQHQSDAQWPRQGSRFRSGQDIRNRSKRIGRVQLTYSDKRVGTWSDPWHGRLHEPRTGPRPERGYAVRHLGLRLHPLRDADRPTDVFGRYDHRHPRRNRSCRSRLGRVATGHTATAEAAVAPMPAKESRRQTAPHRGCPNSVGSRVGRGRRSGCDAGINGRRN